MPDPIGLIQREDIPSSLSVFALPELEQIAIRESNALSVGELLDEMQKEADHLADGPYRDALQKQIDQLNERIDKVSDSVKDALGVYELSEEERIARLEEMSPETRAGLAQAALTDPETAEVLAMRLARGDRTALLQLDQALKSSLANRSPDELIEIAKVLKEEGTLTEEQRAALGGAVGSAKNAVKELRLAFVSNFEKLAETLSKHYGQGELQKLVDDYFERLHFSELPGEFPTIAGEAIKQNLDMGTDDPVFRGLERSLTDSLQIGRDEETLKQMVHEADLKEYSYQRVGSELLQSLLASKALGDLKSAVSIEQAICASGFLERLYSEQKERLNQELQSVRQAA